MPELMIAGRQPDQRNDAPCADAELDQALRAQAERCRRLARGIEDRRARQILQEMADNYEVAAASLRQV